MLGDAIQDVIDDMYRTVEEFDEQDYDAAAMRLFLHGFARQLSACLKAAAAPEQQIAFNPSAYGVGWHSGVAVEKARAELRQQKAENDAQLPVEESPPEGMELLNVLEGNVVVGRLAVPSSTETGHRWTDPASGTVYRVRQIAGNARRFLRPDETQQQVTVTAP